MEFREFGDRRSVQRPNLEAVDLEEHPGLFKGFVDLATVVVAGGDHRGIQSEGKIAYASLTDVGLSETHIQPLQLADVAMVHCDLSNARWHDVEMARAELDGCRAVGMDLEGKFDDLYAVDTRFDLMSLQRKRGRAWTVFERCSFKDAVLGGSFDQVIFRDCDLSGAEFEATSARGADVRGSRLDGVRGLMTLRGATLDADQAREVAEQLAAEAGFVVAP
ncbi:pentapeptide repeat-containing protein [Yinghuangia soli]|uniref:Pentapeptide repeat-containing protein n=1 Tax=Yinghuangia soli TaxID=2908204 RepID=A0AA41Q873_9ACTN|nr:pentapeptide repeat-containing protein [Yinghuangia soli]MCF2532506.1 pentapeptide repeat-containing protein [Yinghuangia soli]